ncbi:MAG: pitrilysin family protein [Caulobacteraceae bacterium]
MSTAPAPAPIVRHLSNGVTVICDPLPGFETLALSVVAGRGARQEGLARAGWSHLLEHMVFKGAGDRSAKAIVEDIESAGGQINADTGHERTSFQARTLAGGLPLALRIIADLVRRPHLDVDDLAREKRVVAQEIAEAADTPDDLVFELAQAAAFADQPLGRPILGTRESLAPADPASLEAWRATLYAPDRLVISAAGAVDVDALHELAAAAFGDAPTLPSPPFAPAVFTGGAAAANRRLEQAHLVFLLPGPALGVPDYWPARLHAEMLGGGMSSRLFQEAREKLGLAYAIDAYAEAYADIGAIGVYAGCAAGDAVSLARVVADQISALADGGEADELARAKTQLKASLFMGRESLSARAEQAAGQWLAFGRLLSPGEIATAIDGVGREDVARFGAALARDGRSAVAALGSKAAGRAAAAFTERLAGG